MMRVPVLSTYLLALTMLAALTGLVGCAHGNGGTAPALTPDLTAEAALPASPSGEGVSLGYYQFVFGDDGTVTVEQADPVRGADMNVTNYALVTIEDFYFNEELRNWYITATIKNMSIYTGYDVLAVFHTLGNKFLINQDGFLWAMPPIFPQPTRCAFIAYGKSQVNRQFPPMYQDTRTIVIHQPDGVPKLAPLGFWIEATLKPRKYPGVEDLMVKPVNDTPDNTEYNLTGFIWDHQSPSSDLTVWADCTNFNGENYVPMYDDGQHGDGPAGDNIFGAGFSGDPEDGFYVITVYAFDPQGNQGENDVGFWHGEEVPCDLPFEHYPFETIDKGEQSGIKYLDERVINDWDTWAATWTEHTGNMFPPPPPPPIDFEKNTVIGVWTGDHPTNNHMVTITDVYLDPCEDLVTVLYDYTPYIGCGPLDVITDPYHIIVLPKLKWPVYFVGTEVDCPPPPPECVEDVKFETLIHGTTSGIKNPYELRITNTDDFHALWQQHTQNSYPPPPPPEVNFMKCDVIAVATGERPTGGFECNIERICWLTDQSIGVFYKERIPGPDCPVPAVFTQPHHWVVIPKYTAPVKFFHGSEVYNCGPTDCVNPQIFWPIEVGDETGHTPGEFVINNQEQWHQFYAAHKPGMTPPPINFQEHMVLAMLIGERPSTGYIVETKEVCLNPNEDGTLRMDVNYVEMQPGENCDVLWVITSPYQLVAVPRFEGPVFFHKAVAVYDCPPDECPPVPWYQMADGIHSCADPGEYVFEANMDKLEGFWHAVHCWENVPPLPPAPDPIQGGSMAWFAVQLDELPTDGYYLTIDDVCVKGCDVFVTYTQHIPGPNCPVADVITKPWVLGVAELPPIDCIFTWYFEKHEEIYNCPGDCVQVPWMPIEEGIQSCAEPGEYGFQGFGDWWMELWYAVHCWNPDDPGYMPKVPPADPGTQWVPFLTQLGERPSTGYYMTVDDVCIEGCDVYVKYTEWIPGENCQVEWIITKPWLFSMAQLPEIDCEYAWHFEKSEIVYPCEEPCNKVPFYQLADGDQSCADPGEFGWQNDDPYYAFWHAVHCWDPNMPPLPVDPDPIQEGIIYHFGIQLTERPTTGYYLTIDQVCIDGCDVYIDYTENIPDINCPVEQVVTKPWLVGAVELPPVYCYWTWHFEKHESVYICPDVPCWDFKTIAGGPHGGETPGGWFFDNQQAFHTYWFTYHPNDPMPQIDFEGGWGGYAVHLGTRPTTGFEVSVYEICQSEEPFGAAVRWIEWIPGETCDVLQIETGPWTLVTFPLVDLPYFDEGSEKVYQCD